MSKKIKASLKVGLTRKKTSSLRWLALVYIGILLVIAYYDLVLFGWGLLIGDAALLFLFLKGYGVGAGSWIKTPGEATIIQRVNLFLQIIFVGLMGVALILFGS